MDQTAIYKIGIDIYHTNVFHFWNKNYTKKIALFAEEGYRSDLTHSSSYHVTLKCNFCLNIEKLLDYTSRFLLRFDRLFINSRNIVRAWQKHALCETLESLIRRNTDDKATHDHAAMRVKKKTSVHYSWNLPCSF